MSTHEKPPTTAESTSSETLKSSSRSVNEKTLSPEAEGSVREGSQAPTYNASLRNGQGGDESKEANADAVEDIRSSEEGDDNEVVEYPTGMKLGLISLGRFCTTSLAKPSTNFWP